MNLLTGQLITALIVTLLCRMGATMTANHDRWNDFDQSHLMESINNSQEVQEALLKMHFAAMAESRLKSEDRSSDLNITMDMSRADFENIVVKINSEVALLRNQALILSRAYKDVMVKHKNTLRELNTLKFYQENSVSDNNRNAPYQPQKPCPYQPTSHTSPQPPPVCNCNCSPSYSETVMGNKYYYYNVDRNPDLEETSQPAWKPQGHKNPTPPNYHQPPPKPSHSSVYRPTRYDSDDPDPVALPRPRPVKASAKPSPVPSSLESKFADLQNIVQSLDHRTDKWNQPVAFDPWKSSEW